MIRHEDRGPAALLAAGLFLIPAATPSPPATHVVPGDGATYAEAPPPAHTGGFGEPTCQACHAEYALNLQGGSLTVAGFPGSYEPGATYILTVTLRSSEMGSAGFELALRHADGRQAGRLSAVDGTTNVTEAEDVQYAHHTAAGAEAVSPEVATWLVEWLAPEASDPVLLHATANSANGDNSPLGDLVYTTSKRSEPSPPPARRGDGGPGAGPAPSLQ